MEMECIYGEGVDFFFPDPKCNTLSERKLGKKFMYENIYCNEDRPVEQKYPEGLLQVKYIVVFSFFKKPYH